MDFHGDHTSTRTAHSGATTAYDWFVGVLGPLFHSAGHKVRNQHGLKASAGQRRGDVEIWSYLRDQAGSRSLVFDLSITHERFGSSSHVQQNGHLTHPQDIDAPLRLASQRKINRCRQQYADHQNSSFLPAILAPPHAYTANFCVFFFYKPTGRPRRTSMPLAFHRNATTRTRFVSSARHSSSR